METLTRLVTDSLARHGFDRPIDPRRLQWSRWFRCDSTHSLLVVPSKPGIFAIAEEVGASVARAPSPATAAQASQNHSSRDSRPRLSARAQLSPPPRQPAFGWRSPSALRFSSTNRCRFSRRSTRPPHARRPPILRRRRYGLHPRSHVYPHQSHARSSFLREMFPALRRYRRPGPAPQHLQRLESMDALLRRKSQRPSRRFRFLGGADHGRRGRKLCLSEHAQLARAPHPRFRSQQESPLSSTSPLRLLTEGFCKAPRVPAAPWKSGASAPRQT